MFIFTSESLKERVPSKKKKKKKKETQKKKKKKKKKKHTHTVKHIFTLQGVMFIYISSSEVKQTDRHTEKERERDR